MGFFSNFFKSDVKSGETAKNRLKVAITSDRAVCSAGNHGTDEERDHSGYFKVCGD